MWWDDEAAYHLEEAPPREELDWKCMMRQPDFITGAMVWEARQLVRERQGLMADDVRMDTFH